MIGLDEKLELLNVIYRVFEDYVRERYPMACAKGCAVCCTSDTTVTTLEAYLLGKALHRSGRDDLIARLAEAAKGDLFRPRLTANLLAMICLSREEPPQEEPGPISVPCPLLEGGLCSEYEARPFSCRGMYSLEKCEPGRQAEVHPELVSIVTACWQIIEHLDKGGLCGNLIDLILALKDERNQAMYEEGSKLMVKNLPPTRPVPGFLIPPDQTETVQGFLDKLFQTDRGGRTFRERMSDVRESPF